MWISFFSRIFPDKETMVKNALDLASDIAEKSPIAVQGTKTNLIYSRDHSVQEGLEYIVSMTLIKISGDHSVQEGLEYIVSITLIKISIVASQIVEQLHVCYMTNSKTNHGTFICGLK